MSLSDHSVSEHAEGSGSMHSAVSVGGINIRHAASSAEVRPSPRQPCNKLQVHGFKSQSAVARLEPGADLSNMPKLARQRSQALSALKAFVGTLGVEAPADTEAELLMQAAPFMSDSLDDNLKNAWTEEERSRLDAQPMPKQLDHTNRDHEYVSQ